MMFRLRQVLILTACALPMLLVQPTASAEAPRVISLKASDNMKYDVTQIAAKPGELLRVRLTSTGTKPSSEMAHNFVLLAAGTEPNMFVMLAALARTTEHIPVQMKSSVLASTGLAGPGETVEVTFKAPTKPGQYVFLCSFPGHYNNGMTGVLTVK